MGCIYTGMKINRWVNGFFKVGQTSKNKPTDRWNAYNLTGLMWVECPLATFAERLYLEGVARLTAERMGMRQETDDCFWYAVAKDKNVITQGMEMAEEVLTAVVMACEQYHIQYTVKKFL